MNTILALVTLLASVENPPATIRIVFWILLILWAIGAFGFHDNPVWIRGSSVLLIILFSILGYFTFGF